MAKKPETIFRESTYDDLDRLKNTYWMSIQQLSIIGDPDIILCISGKFVALEYKKDAKTKPEAIQLYKHTKIRRKGKGKVFVVYPGNWKRIYKKLLQLSKI